MKMDSTKCSHDDKDQEEPFLVECQDQDQDRKLSRRRREHLRYTWHGMLLASVLVHVALLALWFTRGAFFRSILYSPFETVFLTNVENMRSDTWDDSDYVGLPSKRIDDAWRQLQRVIGITFSPEEASKINLTSSIMTKDGDHVVQPAFLHNLHCVRYLYQILHRDTYVKELKAIKGDPEVIGLKHAYHCIEALRDSTVCRPDLNIYGLQWSEGKTNLALQTDVNRECVDFDSIYDIAVSRKVTPRMLADAQDSFLGPVIKADGG
ncbi:802147b3-1a09-4516-854a-ed2cc0674ab3 [Sclerotinia trifoliorum]|uniref:802147b3-1a09-4516-854a-ed2cc0674ab3 n=1 Tax=Sclerotinia trifoliorum TaxID=28548 RepID=A0A8H2ZND1_9HELO|nr:802147b3-1a09-4516-854a-ed2cc0674ab3 [Sclerotinia trifoliorum]